MLVGASCVEDVGEDNGRARATSGPLSTHTIGFVVRHPCRWKGKVSRAYHRRVEVQARITTGVFPPGRVPYMNPSNQPGHRPSIASIAPLCDAPRVGQLNIEAPSVGRNT